MRWRKLVAEGRPAERYNHTYVSPCGFKLPFSQLTLLASMLADELQEKLYIFGGTNGSKTFGDLYIYNLRMWLLSLLLPLTC